MKRPDHAISGTAVDFQAQIDEGRRERRGQIPESPVCPFCKEEMSGAQIEIAEGWLPVWLCGCSVLASYYKPRKGART